MEILATLKKKVNWTLTLNSQGGIQTGSFHEGNNTVKMELDVPIFRVRLKYDTYYHGSSSLSFSFKGSDEDTVISILRGTGEAGYGVSEADGLQILGRLAKRDPCYTYFDDGYFEGIFTFKKAGRNIFLTPYDERIAEDNSEIILKKP